jgi:hypothetical protein
LCCFRHGRNTGKRHHYQWQEGCNRNRNRFSNPP